MTKLKPPAARMRYTRLRRAIESGTLIGTHGTPFQGGAVKSPRKRTNNKISDDSDDEAASVLLRTPTTTTSGPLAPESGSAKHVPDPNDTAPESSESDHVPRAKKPRRTSKPRSEPIMSEEPLDPHAVPIKNVPPLFSP